MDSTSNIMIRYNRILAPIVAVLLGALLLYAALFISDLEFLVPVEVFFVFHFFRIYRIKTRIIASLLVFLVIAIIGSAMYTQITYSYSGAAPVDHLSNGTNVSTTITPYHGPSPSYNLTYFVYGNTTLTDYWINVTSETGSASPIHLTENDIKVIHNANGTLNLYVVLNNITSSGLYEYILYLSNSTYFVPNLGPIVASWSDLFAYEMISYIPGFIIIFELIFLVGVFIGRSLSRRAPPVNRGPPSSQQQEQQMIDQGQNGGPGSNQGGS